MNTETSSGEILMTVTSWFLRKKNFRTGRNLPKKRKNTTMNVHLSGFYGKKFPYG